jgi:hypothetical protein
MTKVIIMTNLAKAIAFSIHALFCLLMISPKFFVMILALAASVVAITVLHSQNVLASAYSGQTSGSIRTGMADLDVTEAEETGNTTMMTNQTTTNGNMTEIEFMAIQHSKSGSISPVNATSYTLELDNIANKTILFSDRPERIEETISTTGFVSNWTAGPNSFESDVPNDALIVENTETGELGTAVIELFNPVYDTTANTLTYTIMAENATTIGLPDEFGQTVLVIDNLSIDPCEIEDPEV